MTALIPFLPFLLLFLFGRTGDPAPGLFTTKKDAARYECERTTREAVAREKPGALKERAPRGDYIEEELIRCSAPLFARGERDARVDALLDALSPQLAGIVAEAEAKAPGTTRWSALAHHDNAAVAGKIRMGLEVELAGRQKTVESALPELTSGDIVTLSTMQASEAFALLCSKLPSQDKAWLAAYSMDAKETVLHAGLCHEGAWTWLM